MKRAEEQRPENQLRDPKEKFERGRGVNQNTYVKIPHQSDEGAKEKEFLLSNITRLRKQFSSRLDNGQTTRSIKGDPKGRSRL